MDSKEQILNEIQAIFRRELNDAQIQLSNTSSADSIEKWDSITNLVLITAIEEKYNITFSIDSIFEMENVGDMVDYIFENASL